MKALITAKSELSLNLTKFYTFDVVSDGEVILSSQSVECRPSELQDVIKNKLDDFTVEYEKDLDIEVGQEVS